MARCEEFPQQKEARHKGKCKLAYTQNCTSTATFLRCAALFFKGKVYVFFGWASGNAFQMHPEGEAGSAVCSFGSFLSCKGCHMRPTAGQLQQGSLHSGDRPDAKNPVCVKSWLYICWNSHVYLEKACNIPAHTIDIYVLIKSGMHLG